MHSQKYKSALVFSRKTKIKQNVSAFDKRVNSEQLKRGEVVLKSSIMRSSASGRKVHEEF